MVDLIIIGVIKIPQLKQLKGACKKKGISRRNDKHSKGKFFFNYKSDINIVASFMVCRAYDEDCSSIQKNRDKHKSNTKNTIKGQSLLDEAIRTQLMAIVMRIKELTCAS